MTRLRARYVYSVLSEKADEIHVGSKWIYITGLSD